MTKHGSLPMQQRVEQLHSTNICALDSKSKPHGGSDLQPTTELRADACDHFYRDVLNAAVKPLFYPEITFTLDCHLTASMTMALSGVAWRVDEEVPPLDERLTGL